MAYSQWEVVALELMDHEVKLFLALGTWAHFLCENGMLMVLLFVLGWTGPVGDNGTVFSATKSCEASRRRAAQPTSVLPGYSELPEGLHSEAYSSTWRRHLQSKRLHYVLRGHDNVLWWELNRRLIFCWPFYKPFYTCCCTVQGKVHKAFTKF